MTRTDAYITLGLGSRAGPSLSQAEIKKAYKRSALTWHPDKGGSKLMFNEISDAYEVLSTPAKRKVYDAHGWAGLGGSDQQQRKPQQRKPQHRRRPAPSPSAAPSSRRRLSFEQVGQEICDVAEDIGGQLVCSLAALYYLGWFIALLVLLDVGVGGIMSRLLPLLVTVVQFTWDFVTLDAFPKVVSCAKAALSSAKRAAAAFQFSVPQLLDRSTVILAMGAALLLYSYALA